MNTIEKLLEDTSIPTNILELQEMIDELWDNIPDKRTKIFKEWKTRTNSLMREFNWKRGEQIYQIIK